jgi:nickel transport protein
MRKKVSGLIVMFFLLGAICMPAEAHKLKVFATAIGADVSGYAYFSPGGRAQEAEVTVKQADGSVVAAQKTNERGEFTFKATRPVDHVILVDAGDGHEASYRVSAEELGSILEAKTPATAQKSNVASQLAAAGTSAGPTSKEIAALVEESVARQIRPLREQVDAWQEKVWLHDVLGGLGYIIGLAGLFYGLTGLRRSKAEASARDLKEARR